MPKILMLAGSTRKASINKKLINCAASIASDHAQVTVVDLRDFEMPFYDGDYEAEFGLPESAKQLKALFIEHQGILMASPEYNGSFSAVLKNAIDWISRPHQDKEQNLIAFKGKVAGLVSASPGPMGGLRGLVPLRMLLGNIGVHVIPNQMALGSASNAFSESGQFNDEKHEKQLSLVINQLINLSKALK